MACEGRCSPPATEPGACRPAETHHSTRRTERLAGGTARTTPENAAGPNDSQAGTARTAPENARPRPISYFTAEASFCSDASRSDSLTSGKSLRNCSSLTLIQS
jgi:hypothetical protein